MFEKLDDVPTHCYNMSRRYNTSVRSSYDDESCSIRHWTDVPRPPSKVYRSSDLLLSFSRTSGDASPRLSSSEPLLVWNIKKDKNKNKS